MAGLILEITSDYGKELITTKTIFLDEIKTSQNTFITDKAHIFITNRDGEIIDEQKPEQVTIKFSIVKNFNINLGEEE